MKLAMMHIFLNSHQEEDYQAFRQAFEKVYQYGVKELSVSPIREYGEYGEIYATLQVEEGKIQELLNFMSSDWDGPFDDCETNSFTAKVFDNHINSLYFQIPDD